jgi:hypothetical protein
MVFILHALRSGPRTEEIMKPKKPLSLTGPAADRARIVRAWKQAAGDLNNLAAKVEHVAAVSRVEHGEPLEGDAKLARIHHVIEVLVEHGLVTREAVRAEQHRLVRRDLAPLAEQVRLIVQEREGRAVSVESDLAFVLPTAWSLVDATFSEESLMRRSFITSQLLIVVFGDPTTANDGAFERRISKAVFDFINADDAPLRDCDITPEGRAARNLSVVRGK